MARRELLMKAKVLNTEKDKIGGWYMSEKLDGGRCLWDGGITRGIGTHLIPWAGILNPKTGQPKTKVKPTATGLWSQYGNPIMAPDWFLNTLPCCMLDGELWAGRGNFQKTMSTIRKNKPIDSEWKQIQFGIFGCPSWEVFSVDGEIKNANQLTDIRGCKEFLKSLPKSNYSEWRTLAGSPPFTAELTHLNEWVDNYSDTHFLILQKRLPEDAAEAMEIALKEKARIILEGGEGLFFRDPGSLWTPKRMKTCLKLKGSLDDEGTLVGFTSGRETEKGSKLLGLIGALILDYKGQRLELSGLTDLEREFGLDTESRWAVAHPGIDMPSITEGKMFKKGDIITFTYRELNDSGIPKEARYMRKRS